MIKKIENKLIEGRQYNDHQNDIKYIIFFM
jgi:hypothetical protein